MYVCVVLIVDYHKRELVSLGDIGTDTDWLCWIRLKSTHDVYENTWKCGELKLYVSPEDEKKKKYGWKYQFNPFKALKPLPILIPSNFVSNTGFQL